jgi:4-amino-4-deoxy-L-arabinose transferase-like glycosyltransferase
MLKLQLLSVSIIGIIWIIIIPIWHAPDEQGHFAEVAYLAQKGSPQNANSKYDLTKEIYTAEKLLGTSRDNLGNNRFTFHPKYRLDYSDSYQGIYEASIAAMVKDPDNQRFVHNEATKYYLLYYKPASYLYNLFINENLITRVFIVRLWSLSLFLFTVICTYYLGKEIFRDILIAIILSILVGFHPMMVFANTGVNNDALANFIFTLFLLILTLMVVRRITAKLTISLLITSIVAILIKPQFIIVFICDILLMPYLILRDVKIKYIKLYTGIFIFLTIFLIDYLRKTYFGSLTLISSLTANFNLNSYLTYTIQYTIPHTIYEVMPWYWGVYNWLGVTYPIVVQRIVNRIVAVCLLGFFLKVINQIRKKKIMEKRYLAVFFLILFNLIFVLALSLYDWLSWHLSTYQLGIQGRYYFPFISVHMLILLSGWRMLFSRWHKVQKYASALFGLLMVIFNFYALYTVSGTYYDISRIEIFIKQVSQYKPYFVKGPVFISLLVVTIIVIVSLFYNLFRYHEKKS